MEKQRLERLRKQMEQRDLPALIITNAVNRRYISGFTGTAGTVLITEDEAIFYTDFRYTEQATQEVPHMKVVEHGADVLNEIAQLLTAKNIKRLAFEPQHTSFEQYEKYREKFSSVTLIPEGQMLEQMRAVKDDQEIAIMKEAAQLADRAFIHILDRIKPGVTEREIALWLEYFMRENGADGTSFTTIVASGERSALPHGVASEKRLASGDFVTFDFGAYYNGYCSDITRTIVLGKGSSKQKQLYDIVLEAQMHAVENIRPGMTGREADALARGIIEKHGYGDRFGHGTGHGVGMEIHESPRLSPRDETILQPGMVVTVEPGIYIPGFGGVRIEDEVLITEDGATRLTLVNKQWTEIL